MQQLHESFHVSHWFDFRVFFVLSVVQTFPARAIFSLRPRRSSCRKQLRSSARRPIPSPPLTLSTWKCVTWTANGFGWCEMCMCLVTCMVLRSLCNYSPTDNTKTDDVLNHTVDLAMPSMCHGQQIVPQLYQAPPQTKTSVESAGRSASIPG